MKLKDIKNKRLEVLVLTSKKINNWIKDYSDDINQYFKIKFIFDDYENIVKYLKEGIDILIHDKPRLFKVGFYHDFQNSNPNFSFVASTPHASLKDMKIHQKDFADYIAYSGYGKDYFIWKMLAVFRRYWNSYSKPSVTIYKDIIANWLEHSFKVNKKIVHLTLKEQKVFKILMDNKKQFVSKQRIFHEVWGHDDIDSTRTVDQTIFKLKKKIGEEYFTFARKTGIKFE